MPYQICFASAAAVINIIGTYPLYKLQVFYLLLMKMAVRCIVVEMFGNKCFKTLICKRHCMLGLSQTVTGTSSLEELYMHIKVLNDKCWVGAACV